MTKPITPPGTQTRRHRRIAFQEALDGTNVSWMEQVTDDEHLAGRPRS